MLMLVDAANLYFRAFYAIPESITGRDGRPVNAIRGFLDMSASLIERRRPDRWVACLDLDRGPAGGCPWRALAGGPGSGGAVVPTNKPHRAGKEGGEKTPAALPHQIPP